MEEINKMSKKSKTTRTYSIDNNLYENFSKIIEDRMYNKSKIIESLIKNWIEENK